MLQKTGWRIKQLISSRGNRDIENQEEYVQDGNKISDRATTSKSEQRQSWPSQSTSQELALSHRRTTSNMARNRPLPPPDYPPTSTACSSASSLCSCDCGVHIDCDADVSGNKHSLQTKMVGGHGVSRQPNPNPDILYLPPLKSSTSLGSDAKTWKLIFSGSPPKSPAYSSQRYIFESQRSSRVPTGLDFLEALALDPSDGDTLPTPTPSVKSMADSKMDSVEDNVEQLIREADAAFEAVGTALVDAKALTQGFYTKEDKPISTPSNLLTRRILKKHQHQRPASPLKARPSTRGTKSKVKRKKSARKQANPLNRPAQIALPPAASSNSHARWTLTDMTSNMADVFSSKMFRTEVDEMLTPDRIQQLREENQLSSDRKSSFESTCSSETASTQSAFHLEGVVSRLNAARANTSPPFPEPILPPPAPPIPRKSSLRKKTATEIEETKWQVEEMESKPKDLGFPATPILQQREARSSRGALPLDTIPEVSTLNKFTSPPLPILSAPEKPMQVTSTADYIFLPSTNFSLTSPQFRHGPVRLSRPLVRSKRKGSTPEEESLDWTAFQMAISGGVLNDDECNKADDEREMEMEAFEAELDGIVQWWEGFGFEGVGRMIGESDERLKKREKVDEVRKPIELKRSSRNTPRRFELPATRIKRIEEARSETKRQPVYRIPPANLKHIPVQRRDDRSRLHAQEADADDEESDYDGSLPPSPMLELYIPTSPDQKDRDVIPMGYNMSHDLGDFLKWESEHRRSLSVND